MEAFLELEIDDVEGIAEKIPTKSEDEVLAYHTTFKQRFFELKMRDQILLKFQLREQDQIHEKVSKDIAKYENYAVFLENSDS